VQSKLRMGMFVQQFYPKIQALPVPLAPPPFCIIHERDLSWLNLIWLQIIKHAPLGETQADTRLITSSKECDEPSAICDCDENRIQSSTGSSSPQRLARVRTNKNQQPPIHTLVKSYRFSTISRTAVLYLCILFTI